MADPSLQNPSGKIVADYCIEGFSPNTDGSRGMINDAMYVNGEIQELEFAPPTISHCQHGAVRIASDASEDPDEWRDQIEHLGFNVTEEHVEWDVTPDNQQTRTDEESVDDMMQHL
jgi:hypothetical protein